MALWAVLSDVHGNLAALDRAVALARERHARRFAFLGDLLGRGDSEGVVQLVGELADLAVVGNRDLDWAPRVSAEAAAYVRSLPRLAMAGPFVAVHGDPRLHRELNASEVARGGRRAYRWLADNGRRLLFFGHTHHARAWRKVAEEAEPELLAGNQVRLDFGQTEASFFINVGSVGLPFPGKGPPSFALLDERADSACLEWVRLS